MSASEPANRKRGRPAVEGPHERLQRLEVELAAAREEVREADRRRFAIIGEAVAAEAEHDAQLKARLAEILSKRVKSAAARAEIAGWLHKGV